ncbi:carbohydrate-binding module family 50 protein [Nemania serpens]|nr:carbohydrate-binding module family 50 protein [Nemania serpens]
MSSHLVSLLVFITPTLGYLVDPPTTAPGDTIQDCTNWVVATSSDTCESIAEDNFIALPDLYIYNPSLSASSCPLIVGDSYCVEENFGVTPPPSTTSSTTGNGVSTPSPVQTGIASNCNKFYYVQDGDTCSVIAAMYGITVAQFYAWNPAAGSTCATLGLHDYVCVGTLDATGTTTTTTASTTTTTTTRPGNGISTPTPSDRIVAAYGISLLNFYTWNPAVGSSCTTLIPGDYVCVGIITPSATTTTSGIGISTPTPAQTGIATNCNRFYLVQPGDACDTIVAKYGIALNNFYAWNPAVGSSCTTLIPGDYVCIGVIGSTTTTTTTPTTTSPTTTAPLGNATATSFTEGEACNLHAGAATHVASSTSAFKFYDSSCFVCPSKCLSASSPLASAICNVKAVSNGGTAIISYSSGAPIQSIKNCAATCLSTTGCTNLYFDAGTYCNLKAGPETHQLSSTSSYVFYEASCFQCSSPSCWTDAQGLAVPQPSGAVCKVAAYSNGGTTIMSYSSGDPITTLKACSAACLSTSGCTNLYYQAGKYCNLHSGVDTHNPDTTSPYLFYDASCFEC